MKVGGREEDDASEGFVEKRIEWSLERKREKKRTRL